MFEGRVKKLLEMIDIDLYSVYANQYVIKDQKNSENYIDIVFVPGEYMSEDQTRKFECVLDQSVQLFRDSSSHLDPDDIHFLRASSQIDALGNDYYSYELEENGTLYDIFIGDRSFEGECHYRKLDSVEGKPFITDILWKEGDFTVSRKYDGSSEKIEMHPLTDYSAMISLYKNGELLEEKKVTGNLSFYYSSVFSAVSDVVLEANQALHRIHPSILSHMQEEFDHFQTFISYQEGCYDADGLDELYRKHELFIEPNRIKSRQ